LTDVMPTVLEAVGVTAPPDLDGISLWPTVSRRRDPPERPLLAESALYVTEQRAVVDWPWKLIEYPREDRRELFDLVADPDERTDLAGERPEVVSRLSSWGAARAAAADASDSSAVELDEETREALRALGYVD
jgi:arylsulfatase A-like enzyme